MPATTTIPARTESVTDVTVEHYAVPPVASSAPGSMIQSDLYAVVRCGEISAEITRFAYLKPKEFGASCAIGWDARINGLPDNAGVAQILAENSSVLFDLAQVAIRAAMLLDKARSEKQTADLMTAYAAAVASRNAGASSVQV